MATRSKLARVILGVGTSALVFTAAVGALHTKWGRPLLAKIGVGCPVNKATAEEVEVMRQRGLADLRGAAAAPGRPAFGFHLDATTRDEALALDGASAASAASSKKRGGDAIFCHDVPPDAVAEPFAARPVDELDLMFDPDGRLIQIETMRRRLPSAEAEGDPHRHRSKADSGARRADRSRRRKHAAYFDGGGAPDLLDRISIQ